MGALVDVACVEGRSMGDLEGQVAIVTGGAWGIGGATARRLARDGARVLIADLDGDGGEENVARISEAGGTALAMSVDVSDGEQIEGMVRRAADEWGRLDVLVQNAYRGDASHQGSAVTLSEEGWDSSMDVLVKALFLGAKHAVPQLESAGGGSIVNMASVHGMLMAPGRLAYEAGKSAVIGMTKQMATDFGPSNIRVNCVLPGHIVTERQEERWAQRPEMLEFFRQHYPLRRVGQPDDIANAVAFLCSSDASFITGHALAVDGGMTVQLQEDLTLATARYAREHDFELD
jgi:NAD(P)-dependent dehydrogenase (short-subunit alcohol dehydrogenase family)